MTAQIIAFPRKKAMEWHELPDYWGYPDKAYYTDAIKDGMRPDDAFRLWDLIARAPSEIQALQFKRESDKDYMVRLESIALSPDEASARAKRERDEALPRYPGEDVLLRQAQEAFARMKKKS